MVVDATLGEHNSGIHAKEMEAAKWRPVHVREMKAAQRIVSARQWRQQVLEGRRKLCFVHVREEEEQQGYCFTNLILTNESNTTLIKKIIEAIYILLPQLFQQSMPKLIKIKYQMENLKLYSTYMPRVAIKPKNIRFIDSALAKPKQQELTKLLYASILWLTKAVCPLSSDEFVELQRNSDGRYASIL